MHENLAMRDSICWFTGMWVIKAVWNLSACSSGQRDIGMCLPSLYSQSPPQPFFISPCALPACPPPPPKWDVLWKHFSLSCVLVSELFPTVPSTAERDNNCMILADQPVRVEVNAPRNSSCVDLSFLRVIYTVQWWAAPWFVNIPYRSWPVTDKVHLLCLVELLLELTVS